MSFRKWGAWVKGRLEPFRKFFRFATVFRPLPRVRMDSESKNESMIPMQTRESFKTFFLLLCWSWFAGLLGFGIQVLSISKVPIAEHFVCLRFVLLSELDRLITLSKVILTSWCLIAHKYKNDYTNARVNRKVSEKSGSRMDQAGQWRWS